MPNILSIIHGVDYLINHFLMGSVIFYLLIVRAGGKVAFDICPKWRKYVSYLIGIGFASSFASSFAWTVLSVQDMTESWQFDSLWIRLSETLLAHICLLKLAILLFAFTAIKLFKDTKNRSHN